MPPVSCLSKLEVGTPVYYWNDNTFHRGVIIKPPTNRTPAEVCVDGGCRVLIESSSLIRESDYLKTHGSLFRIKVPTQFIPSNSIFIYNPAKNSEFVESEELGILIDNEVFQDLVKNNIFYAVPRTSL